MVNFALRYEASTETDEKQSTKSGSFIAGPIFSTTYCNIVSCAHSVAPCCAEILRVFGQPLGKIMEQCCDVLR